MAFKGGCLSAKVNGKDILDDCNSVIHMSFLNGRVIFIFVLNEDGKGSIVAFSGGNDRQPLPDDYWLEVDTIRTVNDAFRANGECRVRGNIFEDATLSCIAVSINGKDKFEANMQYHIEGWEWFSWE
ncbi:MAG TPA: hypothetical protein ENK48_02575 [Gammaproteobacteria bacterium]|nr:hypothetical protein [Gammaproteobacteria bacterium]